MKYLREPVNGITHFIGAFLSIIGLIAMLLKVTKFHNNSIITYFSIIFFGVGMILLYTASAAYHSIKSTDSIIKKFKKIDHTMIFVLIMGSYCPFCLIALHNSTGYYLFGAVTSACIIGVIFQLCWVTCPRWLNSIIYIAIGWFAVFAIYPISKAISSIGLFFLVIGGIIYSIGGVIYGLKKDAFKIGAFGTHEIFHIFIMIGTLCHFISVYGYII